MTGNSIQGHPTTIRESLFLMHRMQLRKDVADKKHKTMKPSQLQKSCPEYHMFDSVKFKEHIYQEVHRQKFINSCLSSLSCFSCHQE